eukprot:TRINITY_DN4499_c1_g1_i1.p1 TRINITY_DN4499_c1_g1~~TRINITY_DN4499_c1_g1_i1.p1  ORF type:complete len:621 (-),score=113.05 TRINITY_DN4499_c1_g1_i1:1088-2950(-)
MQKCGGVCPGFSARTGSLCGMATAKQLARPVSLNSVFLPVRKQGMGDESMQRKDRGIQIFLAAHRRLHDIMPLRVLSSDTIKMVKMRISRLEQGFYTKSQRLVYGGRELSREDAGLHEYGVDDGQVLHLLLKLTDVVDVTVETQSGNIHLFLVERSRRVRDLKKQVLEKEGDLGVVGQELVLWGGKTGSVEDNLLIDDLVLDGETMVHLVAMRRSKVRVKQVGRNFELSVDASDVPFQDNDAKRVLSELPVNVRASPVIERAQLSQSSIEAAVGKWREKEILGKLGDMLIDAEAGFKAGNRPVLSREGLGGAYFLQDGTGSQNVAVFKPTDEEPLAINNPKGLPMSENGEGLKKGTRVGEGAFREIAAYLLDHPLNTRRDASRAIDEEGFAGVPPTMLAYSSHGAFNHGKVEDYRKPKLGSLQKFISSVGNCEDFGPSHFHPQEVHKISVLDIRLANTDRNGENILVCSPRGGNKWSTLVPIDHGYSIPETFEDCTFEWLCWPQAHLPYNAETTAYIERLDVEQDIALLKSFGWSVSPECARVLRVSTLLLKKGATKGLTPHTIGSMMCRARLTVKSELEKLLDAVEAHLQPASTEEDFMAVFERLLEVALSMKPCPSVN